MRNPHKLLKEVGCWHGCFYADTCLADLISCGQYQESCGAEGRSFLEE